MQLQIYKTLLINPLFIFFAVPHVKLTGNADDYRKMIASLKSLKWYGLNWWIKPVIKILNEFINALEGNVNVDFWKKIYRFESNKMSGGTDRITGWITHFFPYIKNTKFWKIKTGLIRNPHLFGRDVVDLELDDFPSGVFKVPFTLRIGPTITKMNLIAGFIGTTENKENNFLKSEIHWLVQKE